MKLELVGELPNHNPYEVACELAQDVDLSRGTLRPRLDDTSITSGDIKRVACADGGLVRYSTSSGYCFSWGQDVYWLNGSNSWQKVDAAGNTTSLSAPDAPTLQWASRLHKQEDWTHGSWNVNPPWTGVSGTVTRTFTFTQSQNWSGVKWLWAQMSLPVGAESSLVFKANGTTCPTAFYRPSDNSTVVFVWADVSEIDMSAFASFALEYTWDSSHNADIGFLYGEWGIPKGRHVYIATTERNGIESVVSGTVDVQAKAYSEHVPLGCGVRAQVSGCASGDTVRLYRAIDGVYHLVASGTATGTSIQLDDIGDVGEPYRPSGILPYGPAFVIGNRVAVASGRTVYLSQPGSPIRFGTLAINEDNQDAFSVVLPESVVALSHHELGVIAHTRNHQYVIRLQPQFEGDLLHRVPPAKLEAPTARSHRAVWGQLLVDAEGNVWLAGQRLFGGLTGDVHCVEVDGRLYVGAGSKVYVSKPSWKGWVEFSVSGTIQWMTTDGTDVYVATSSGLFKLEGSTTRKSSCVWRTGKLFGDRISAVRYVHIAGTASTLKLKRPGLSDVSISNATGRVHVPAAQQTHEWQLEFTVASEIFTIHILSEGGVR